MYATLKDILPRKVRDKARAARLTRFARIMGGRSESGKPIAGQVILNDEGRACTDGKTVWIPRTMHDDEVMNLAMQEAILAHEAAGHLKYTDFAAWERMVAKLKGGDADGGDPLLHHIVNIMEDARVNHLLSQDFAGSGKRLDATQEHFHQKHCEHWATVEEGSNDRQGALIAMMAECIIGKESPARSKDIDAFMDEVRPILKTAIAQPHTNAVIKQSERILKTYRTFWPRQVEEEDGGDGATGNEGSEYQWVEDCDAGDIMGDDMSPSEIKKTAEKCKEQDIEADEVSRGRFRDKDMPSKPESKESGDSGEKGAESGEEGDEADSSADGAEGAEGEAESGEEGDESCDGSSKDAKATDKTNEEGEMPERGDHTDTSEIDFGKMEDREGGDFNEDEDGRSDESSEEGELLGDLRSELEEALEEEETEAHEIKADDAAEIVAADGDNDEEDWSSGEDEYGHGIEIQATPGQIVDMLEDDGEESRNRYDQIIQENKGSIETLVGEIRRQLESRTTKTTRGQRRGLLDQRNLWKHKTNPRVFMVEDRPAKPHAAVSLLIDASGSMGSGPKSRAFYATEAGIVLAEVMDKLGFAFEVVDFNSMYGGTYKSGYTAMNVRKPFEGQMNQVSKAAIATDHTGRENSDGHAVEWCVKRVQKQDATHRFVFAISDGQPAGPCPDDCSTPSEHLKRVVANCPDDVQIFSVGIAGMDTSRYYDNSVSVHNTAELGEKILPVLRNMLGQMRVAQ